MLKRFLVIVSLVFGTLSIFVPSSTLAAAGIFPSGGKTVQEGVNFTVFVTASGATFDSLQGTISVKGPVKIVSFSGGSATWLPGKAPANNNQFVGIVSPKSSLTVASITLRGTSTGNGSVSVTGARLASNGTEVGSSGGTTSFKITRAPTPPGQVSVSSSTHPDQNESYEATTATVSWTAPANGASGYSTVLDQAAETVPAETVNTSEITVTYESLSVGTHYFHVRALNSDGWGAATHFKINIKPSTDTALQPPSIATIKTVDGTTNDIVGGTLKGILLEGTGPAGYAVVLTFTPDIALPTEKYPAPVVNGEGNWTLLINEPLKSGFYSVTTQASKDGTVSSVSAPTLFEVSVKDGGGVNIISSGDETVAYRSALDEEASRVASRKSRDKKIGLIGLGSIVLALGALFYFKRKIIFVKKT